jgi:hypothetical protein
MTIPTNLISQQNLPIIKTKEDGCIFTHGYREYTKITDNSYCVIQLFDENYKYIKENLVESFDRIEDLKWSYTDVFGKTREVTTLQYIGIDLQGNYCVLRTIYFHGLMETQRDYRTDVVQDALKQVTFSKTKEELIKHITDYL